MLIGRFIVEQLSEGLFGVDKHGGFERIPDYNNVKDYVQPKVQGLPPASAVVGIDPILISDPETGAHILLDAGFGLGLDHGSALRRGSNLRSNLQIFDLTPEDITHVILTHLHYDHAAGLTYVDEQQRTQLTLPNASVFVQQREWDFALECVQNPQAFTPDVGYDLDELYKVAAEGQFQFIQDNQLEIMPGLTVYWTGGHTPGHQIVKLTDEGETAYYLGDLLPSDAHLNHYTMHQLDVYPEHAKEIKYRLMKRSWKEEAMLLFYHSHHHKFGRLTRDDSRKYVLHTD
jgi:glyoxylase-like metal-dependent hydrolase (beta-lactamase superfamily II)